MAAGDGEMAGGIAALASAEEKEPAATLLLLGATKAPAGGAPAKVMSFVEEASPSDLVRHWFLLRLRSIVLVAGKEEAARGGLRAFCAALSGRLNFCSRSRCASAGWESWSPVAVDRTFSEFAALVRCEGQSASRLPIPSVLSADRKSEWASRVAGGTMTFARGVVPERGKECSIAPDLKMNAPTTPSAAKNRMVIGVLADGDCPRMLEREGDVGGGSATAGLLGGNFGVDGGSALVFPLVFGNGSTMGS